VTSGVTGGLPVDNVPADIQENHFPLPHLDDQDDAVFLREAYRLLALMNPVQCVEAQVGLEGVGLQIAQYSQNGFLKIGMSADELAETTLKPWKAS